MEKSPEAFRTISEVADWLDTPAHVLRFWESRFPEIAPVKRAGGRRYYRPEDMQLLGGIKHLLHTEGHTIKSVQERLKAGGTGAICAFSPPLATGPAGAEAEDPAGEDEPAVVNGHDDAAVKPAAIWHEAAPGPDDGLMAAPSGEPEMTSDAVGPGLDAPLWEADPEGKAEELPPIGFFFDDSDDAAPAEDQSGTFAAQAPEPDPAAFPGPQDEPAALRCSAAPGHAGGRWPARTWAPRFCPWRPNCAASPAATCRAGGARSCPRSSGGWTGSAATLADSG